MKTKPILLATAGSTVDGREITDMELEQIVSSFDPKTYGARVNLEHIRGISGQAPFQAYGDVLSVSLGEVDVNFNGKMEKRKALFGVLDLTDNAKALIDAGQKVYPSIEILPNFGGKGFSYLGGVALTDSPAAIATERMQFNRFRPDATVLSADAATAIEADDGEGTTESVRGLIAGFSAMLDKVAATFAPKVENQTQPETPATPAPADFSALRPALEAFGQTVAASIEGLRTEFRAEADTLAVKLKKLEETRETTPATSFRARPLADGNAQNTGAYAGF
ncbi:hypothetical protein GTZ99_03195 [Novosphingobium sp. FSY-8]|uniref:Capsid scaffolding serine peptidase GPO n=1 Tax=Novosphingobium ovatum TaxID=1908523 RepID=A0ABW9XAJ9_9SPHN|nr:GPO family capsid scaffolding protein [Novosphingobium ovatum]NBC35558.1 hypothetical protein [Novosphingobium ovatum]